MATEEHAQKHHWRHPIKPADGYPGLNNGQTQETAIGETPRLWWRRWSATSCQVCRVFEGGNPPWCCADASRRDARPLLGLVLELAVSGFSELVIFGPPLILRLAPDCGQPTASSILCSAGNNDPGFTWNVPRVILRDPVRDAQPVHGFEEQYLQDQKRRECPAAGRSPVAVGSCRHSIRRTGERKVSVCFLVHDSHESLVWDKTERGFPPPAL
jgi:hypothetical protein